MSDDGIKISPVLSAQGDGNGELKEPLSPVSDTLKPAPVAAAPIDDATTKQVDDVLYSDV
jgi:hypothetical protein